MDLRSANLTSNDGVRLHYLESGQGERPIVLLPGWTQPAAGFTQQLVALRRWGRCIAVDYRGHGESERPPYGYRVSRLARDCFDLFEELGLEDAVLLGHSAGCAVIWSFIDLFGEDRLRGLVLCDEPIAFLKRPDWSERQCQQYGAIANGQEALDQAAAIAARDGEQVLCAFLSQEFSHQFSKSEIENVVAGSLRVPRRAAADLMLSIMQADFRDLLPRIQLPTLCIGGQQSQLGPHVMPWIASQIPNSQTVMLDTPHFVHLEEPALFNRAVLEFLTALDD